MSTKIFYCHLSSSCMVKGGIVYNILKYDLYPNFLVYLHILLDFLSHFLDFTENEHQGDTVEQDYHKTSIWTKKLAKKKNGVGQYNLGILYKYGHGVRKDYLEASKWFIFSSDQGNIDAMFELGFMKFSGITFKMDSKEAIEMYYTSAIGGNMDACFSLGNAYWNGAGVQQDQDKALKVYDYSARHGNTESQYRLGRIYEEGRNVEADQEKANEYYRMTLSTHNPYFVFNFAVKFLNGYILVPNKNEIFHLFNKFGTYGIFERRTFLTPIFSNDEIINCYNLIDMLIELSEYGIDNLEYDIGYAYDYGKYSSTFKEVFESDYKKALKWYTISANKGDTRALYRLGLMHEAGKGTEQDLAVALDCYRKAADNNNNDAKYRLACMHLMGHSIPQDIVKAFYLFTDAANSNHLESIKALMLSNDTNDVVTDDFQKPIGYEAAFIQDPQILFTEEDQIGMLETMAEEGLVAVQYQLGKLYQRKDNPAAAKWFNFAARGGISDACYRLGVFHEEGKYIQQNDERAIELYEKASKGDHEDAIYRLAKMYQSGKGTPVDYVRAYNLYFRASEMGHNLAFKALNITTDQPDYSSGTTMKIISDTTSQEYQQSLLMCEHVAKEGDVELQYKIGTVYEYHLKEPNYSKALKWEESYWNFRKKKGNMARQQATSRLHLLVVDVDDGDKDTLIDDYLLKKAVDGDPVAQLEVGKTYFHTDYTESNRFNTFDWISRSANQGNLEAQFRLGDLYSLGWGTKQCRTSAYEWYTKVAIQGYKKALIRIHNLYQEDSRMNCRGLLNSEEDGWWSDRRFIKDNNIRVVNEYREKKSIFILNGAMDYYVILVLCDH
ncbi:HCP-like protein [Backusella circina FSU 941]|nr:HCP-like protein [Backusella circina FSU 941]